MPIPPEELQFVGAGDYRKIGELYVGYFKELCALSPSACVLDVGSGNGRIAASLAEYLRHGNYDGIEIVADAVEWCRENISSRHPHFRFHHADIYNRRYNAEGMIAASEYRFPFSDATFDFVFLTSVFTHMLPEDVAHYLDEIARVTAPGGTVLATCFLLTADSRELLDAGKGIGVNFPHRHGVYRTAKADIREAAVAYDSGWLLSQYPRAGLAVSDIRYGSWCGRPDSFSHQDIVVARRH